MARRSIADERSYNSGPGELLSPFVTDPRLITRRDTVGGTDRFAPRGLARTSLMSMRYVAALLYDTEGVPLGTPPIEPRPTLGGTC
ncbi:hypothetical protein FOZ63_005090 [Perkinsus olseni]|uniref:Uncharacterized protein n=1 Tax=Perkinsus olseni TaxID=32597 RepID=A0A7J6TFY3_PEROL|nr:hypothetical protein FOZ62_014559 [Perkinsus olseni]KAF4743280.1 hypothetical protein FOZ63_005090 [Perkinsus olseni]